MKKKKKPYLDNLKTPELKGFGSFSLITKSKPLSLAFKISPQSSLIKPFNLILYSSSCSNSTALCFLYIMTSSYLGVFLLTVPPAINALTATSTLKFNSFRVLLKCSIPEAYFPLAIPPAFLHKVYLFQILISPELCLHTPSSL